MKCTLSYSGLVVGSNGRDFLLSEIIEDFHKSYRDKDYKYVEYDEKEGIFKIGIDYSNSYEIQFNDRQKALFEGKGNDSNIKKLQKLLLDYDREELLRQAKEEIKEGVYPTNEVTYNVYADSLNKDLLHTGANLVKME